MDYYEINKRRFDRLILNYTCKLTIWELNNNKVKMEFINIDVQNIGLGGLQFQSELWFPIQEDMILKFDNTIFGSLYGFIIWENVETDKIKYGVKFTTNVIG
jgi:hypothetical protein